MEVCTIGFTLTSDQAKEVEFISGVTSTGTVSGTSFTTWNGSEPPTYGTTSDVANWGTGTAGTGATITYGFDAASGWSAAEQAAFTSSFGSTSFSVEKRFQTERIIGRIILRDRPHAHIEPSDQ